jgi:3-oxoacyl-[acyl-carrier-protein] synthase I
LLIATGEPRPGFADAASQETVAAIAAETELSIQQARSAVVGLGHAGFGFLLERGLEMVAQPGSGAVIVGAVDSYHHPDCMRWLDESFRLHGEGTENGIIPSEGAAFVVLAPALTPGLARVSSVACALEEGHEEGATPDLGQALSEVIRRAAEGASMRPVPWLLTDMNGERHRTRRWSFVKVRNGGLLSEEHTTFFDGPDELGDAGAALGGLLAVHAILGFTTGHASVRRSALIGLASEGAQRSAFALEAP